MKKGMVFTVLLLVLVFNFFSIPADAADRLETENIKLNNEGIPDISEQEPNDSFDTANEIALEDLVSGTMTAMNNDMYKITIPRKGYLSIYGEVIERFTSTIPRLNVVVYKILPDGKKEPFYGGGISWDDEGGFYGGHIVEPGTYYLQIYDNEQRLQGERYTFSTELIETDVTRISGETRFETAVQVAYEGWSDSGTDEILLATGRNFPDALAAGPLAYYKDAPILLTEKDSLPSAVINAINDLGVKKVTIIGGTSAVSKEVEDYLRNLNLTIERIAGSDRYETAVEIAKKLPKSNTSIVVYSQNFPDALSISSYAAAHGYPILLADTNSLKSVIKNQINNYQKTYVIGGRDVVSESVFNQLPNPTRISGNNRYETSVNVATYFYAPVNQPGMHYSFVTTGTNFADALTGSVLAAFYGQPIVLTPSDELHPLVKEMFKYQNVLWYTIIGGESAVSQNIEDEIWSLIR